MSRGRDLPKGGSEPGSGGLPVDLSPGLRTSLETLARARGETALFFDIDGVLAPIRPLPEQASVPPDTRRILGELAKTYLLVAVVSGRDVASASGLVDVPGVVVVGDHGRAVRDRSGLISEVGGDGLIRLRGAGDALASDPRLRSAGVRVEIKRGSISLHTRGAGDPSEATAAATAAASDAAERFSLTWREGRQVFDIRIPGVDKGTAVARLVARTGASGALYVGDDSTDIDAMRALADLRSQSFMAVLLGVDSSEMPPLLPEVCDHLVSQSAVETVLRALLVGADPFGD